MSGLMSTPSVRMAVSARPRIEPRSSVAMRLLKTYSSREGFSTSRLSRMFSVAVKPGIRENS